MDTDKLNRELQIFRNHVKMAREHIIHKLVRDIRFWKEKNTADPSNKRASRKVQSIDALISYIRSQSASELTKAVIRFKPKKKCTGEVNLPDRALTRFYEHKKLQPEMKTLIRRFALNTKMDLLDKYWKNKGEGKKEKSGSKPSLKRKRRKEGKLSSISQSKCSGDIGGVINSKNYVNNSTHKSATSDIENDEEEAGKFVRLTSPKKCKAKHRSKGKKGIFNTPEEEEADGCTQVQDNFFITPTGSAYIATTSVVEGSEQDDEKASWKRSTKRDSATNGRAKICSNKETTANIKAIPTKRPRGNPQSELSNFHSDRFKSLDLHPPWVAKQRDIKHQPGNKITNDDSNPLTQNKAEDLHPSWIAKQKEKGIKPFAGKRTVFDSDEVTLQAKTNRDNAEQYSAGSAKQIYHSTFAGKDPSQEQALRDTDLHPSWLAKQKEKGIKQFQGKKITFDD